MNVNAGCYIAAKGGVNHGNETYNQNHEKSFMLHVDLYQCACIACSLGKKPVLLEACAARNLCEGHARLCCKCETFFLWQHLVAATWAPGSKMVNGAQTFTDKCHNLRTHH